MIMIRGIIVTIAFLISLLSAATSYGAKVSVLVDLDPASAAQTVIVESLAADGKSSIDGIGASIIKIQP